ncbi:hypothetical protein MKO96_15640 [Bacillus sp. ES1-5]|nr:hypothetical protein [Bacillus sp. ES1-5]
MRGGTSKGFFFLDKDLPSNQSIRDEIIFKSIRGRECKRC